MKVLVFTPYYLPGYKGGGPIKTIKNLFERASGKVDFKLITSDRDLGDESAFDSVPSNSWVDTEHARVFYSKPGISSVFQTINQMRNSEYDIVYLNSFFSIRFSLYPLLIARTLGKKVVLGPRGEFSSGALKIKSLKKIFFIKFYKLLGLHRDTVFQASSKYEKNDIQSTLGEEVDIIIAEDIGSQNFAPTVDKQRDRILRLIFVSRISPMKNLKFAIDALNHVKSEVKYDIFGPIEDKDYWESCQKVIDNLPDNVEVSYKGTIPPVEVVSIMSRYDMFYMPTLGENYGHVIAEALCAGLPLLIANTTPWTNLQEKGLGWELPLSCAEKYAKVIDDYSGLAQSEYLNYRRRVLSWAKDKFSQDDAVQANVSMFKYALGRKDL